MRKPRIAAFNAGDWLRIRKGFPVNRRKKPLDLRIIRVTIFFLTSNSGWID